MDSESAPLYKTAELVRDAVGCYYFICLQCGKDFENLEDTVLHIEKYFYEPSDDNNMDTVSNDSTEFMVNEVDPETMVTNIKKESFEEYEDYKLSIPYECDDDGATTGNSPDFCPLCPKTLSQMEGSLESHLIAVHHRNRKYAKIYECKICRRNTFTRPYDLERHYLTHRNTGRAVRASTSIINDKSNSMPKHNGDRNQNSMLPTISGEGSGNPILVSKQSTSMLRPVHSTNVLPSVSNVNNPPASKRPVYVPIKELNEAPLPKKIKTSNEVPLPKKIKAFEAIEDRLMARRPFHGSPPNYCSICRSTFSKKDTLETHLIRVHRRHKHYAKIYECNVCGKNSFTRPYDLRRHHLTHMSKRTGMLPAKVIKTEPKTEEEKPVDQVPLVNHQSTVQKPASLSPLATPSTSSREVQKIATEIRTTDPEKDGILCAICSMKFESYLDVTMHLKFAHNQKRTYKCNNPNCASDVFSNAFLLHRHEMSHSVHYRTIVGDNQNQKSMKCVFCRRSFNKKWNLMKHEKRHLLEMSEQ